MTFITVLMSAAILSIAVWGRRSLESRWALTVLVGAGGLFIFFAGMLLLLVGSLRSTGMALATCGALALAVGLPVMHLGAKNAA